MGDLFDNTENLFVKLAKFEEVYHQLKDAIIEWTEKGQGVYHWTDADSKQYEHKASMKQNGALIRCSNPRCRQGGFNLEQELSSLAVGKQKKIKNFKKCMGFEQATPGQNRINCLNGIDYKITLVYK
ncbi:MAG: hypothetical protein JW734_03830 [Candidatus Omnitrophica bacterium]|nr:hypothetical protein [Candidatus Omnitrophota bacterium]